MPKTSNWTRMQDEETKVRRYIWKHDYGKGYVTVIWKNGDYYDVVHHFDLKMPTESIEHGIAGGVDTARVARNKAVDWMDDNPNPMKRPPKMF